MRKLTFAFPFRKASGDATKPSTEFTDQHEFHRLLRKEPGGAYAVSRKGLWHGGIHITETGAGASLDLRYGVRCMADGAVVAWRLNKTYLTSDIPAQGDTPAFSAHYSSSFALVRHMMEFPKDNTLTFYSLYMHLQDLASYDADKVLPRPSYWTTWFEVAEGADDKPDAGASGRPAPAEHTGLRVRASKSTGKIVGILPRGAQVSLGKRKGNWGRIEAVHASAIVPPKVGGYVEPGAAVGGWIYLGKERGAYVVKPVMPETAQDCVVVPAKPIPIKAGQLIGHIGRFDSISNREPARMVHLEVFCDSDIRSFIEESRSWLRENAAHPKSWEQLGLSATPTILRIDRGTTLYRDPHYEGRDAPISDIVQSYSLAELGRRSEKPFAETENGSDGKKMRWWKVDGADVRRRDISGWVREENFPGGRVSREFAQKWVDFEILEASHNSAHTIFASAQAYVDYSTGADVPRAGAIDKLSPLMQAVCRQLYATGDGSQAANDLCVAAQDTWAAMRASRLIVRHESEWANPGKWTQLITEIEKRTGPDHAHEAERIRIEKLTWWEDVKARIADLPNPQVFHIHPIGMIGNFSTESQIITLAMLLAADSTNSTEYYESILPHMNKYAKVYSVDTPRRIAHFLSQAAHESRFRASEESLNYSAANMRATYGCKGGKKNYDPACDDCRQGRLREKLWSQSSYYERNSERLANYVYANRMENGDEVSGDGFKYRGRGIIQVTGKIGYRLFQDEHNRRHPDDVRDFVGSPELLSSNLEYGVESAFVFWFQKAMNSIADTGSVADVTQRVNGGQNGYHDRLARFNRLTKIFGLEEE
ncbi:glycoside hydrolase family 19 protein [Cupriavidus campinensis]